MRKEILFLEKSNLTIEAAAAYFNIGTQKLRKLAARENCKRSKYRKRWELLVKQK